MLSLGTGREDGVRSITYDKQTGGLEACLVVEARPRDNHGLGRVAVDLGETVLMSAAFSDGPVFLYSGRLIKAIRRYRQKVRSRVKPPSKEHPRMSRRYREIAHKER